MGWTRAGWRAILGTLLAGALACGAPGPSEPSDGARERVAMEASFADLDLPSYDEVACSPEFEPEPGGAPYELPNGIRIAAPARIELPDDGQLPVCGSYRIPIRFIAVLGKDAVDAMTLVVVDQARNQPHAFSLARDIHRMDEPDPLDPNDYDESDVEHSHFNLDVLELSDDFTLQPGRYTLYATLDQYRSNVVEVEVVEQDPQ